MNAQTTFYVSMIACGLFGAAGDIAVYRWAVMRHGPSLVFGSIMCLLALVVFGFAVRMSERSLAVAFTVAAVMHSMIVISWDWLFEGRQLHGWEYSGMLFVLLGVLLLECSKRTEIAAHPGT